LILILMFCFALAGAAETISPAESNPQLTELRENARQAEERGDLAGAERYYVQALKVAEDANLPADQFAAAQHLGRIHWKNDNGAAAVTYMRQAATIVDRHFPADSRSKGVALNNLAIVLRDTGSLDESEQKHLEALHVFQSLNAEENVADTYDGLSEVEIGRGKYALAEEYSKKSLAIQEKRGMENMTTGRTLETLARILVSIGRTKEAEELIPRAEAIFRQNLPSANGDLLPCLDTKAIVLFEQRRFAEAERLWKSVIESAQTARLTPIIVGATYHLAEFYSQTKQYDKAQELFQQLLGPDRNAKLDDVGRALIGGQLAYVLMQQNQGERAEALFQSAVSRVADSPLNASLPYALMCVRYGKLKARQKDWHKAASYLERGMKIQNETIPQSGALAEALEASAQVYRKLSRSDDAKDCQNRAKAIRAALEKPQQTDTVDVGALAAEMR
jgi:tetratricopeptide (TPR) repeat protein